MSEERRSHAVLDSSSRNPKARKIEALLRLDRLPGPIRMLEVGAGGGGISHYFGTHPSGRFDVEAVDVRDERTVVAGYRFYQVADTRLPFENARFDVVVSNHVIEHVGDRAAQRQHLAELGRVLRPGGIGYLAVPNRWMVFEPHYLAAVPELAAAPLAQRLSQAGAPWRLLRLRTAAAARTGQVAGRCWTGVAACRGGSFSRAGQSGTDLRLGRPDRTASAGCCACGDAARLSHADLHLLAHRGAP